MNFRNLTEEFCDVCPSVATIDTILNFIHINPIQINVNLNSFEAKRNQSRILQLNS